MTAQSAAMLAEAAAVRIVRAGEVKKRILHFDAFDIADAGGGNIHMSAGIDAVAVRRRAHAGAMDIVEPLRHRDAFAGVAAVKITGAADEFQITRGRGIDVFVSAGCINHFGDGFAYGGHEHVADARCGAAGGGIFAIEYAAFRHVNFHRAHLAVAPGHVPEKCVGQRQREMSDRARQRGIMIGVGLRTGAGKVEIERIAFFGHRAVKLLRDRLARLAVEGRDVLACYPSAVGHGAQFGARPGLRVFDHFFARLIDELETELFDQAEIAPRTDVIAGDHRLEIEPDILRVAAHAGERLKDIFAELVFLDDLQPRDANPLVKDLVGAAAQDSTGVRRVRAGRRPGDQFTAGKRSASRSSCRRCGSRRRRDR